MLLCPLLAGGCAFQLSSLIPNNDSDLDHTGSLSRPTGSPQPAAAATPSEYDLAYARAAAADVLAHGGKDASVPWQNPHTGAGGNITPLASSYSEGSFTCRDFLASYVRGQSQAWLTGEACRTPHGRWEVKSLNPMKQS